jgi:hypothetical protein
MSILPNLFVSAARATPLDEFAARCGGLVIGNDEGVRALCRSRSDDGG